MILFLVSFTLCFYVLNANSVGKIKIKTSVAKNCDA